MRGRAALFAAAFALSVAAATGARACSMAPGYKVPTGLELATRADAIVLATITGERAGAHEWDGVVLATPVRVLKGTAPTVPVEIKGAYLAKDSESLRMVAQSAPRELRAPNPGALIGGCVRYIFAPGMQLVLFLKRDATGAMVPIRSAFARDAEDVAGPEALWVKAVREYAAIGAGPRGEVKARLKARAAALRAAGDADSVAIAQDMDRERAGSRQPPYD